MSEIYGDVPNVPEGLKKGLTGDEVHDVLQENPTKRSGKHKVVRHKVKQLIKNLVDNMNR